MSSTEVLPEPEEGSSAPDSDQNHLKQTPTSNKQRKSRFSANKLPADIREDIESMYNSIPQLRGVFEVFDRIGSGTFSSVYLAGLREHLDVKEQFALKHIIPTSHPSRIENELRCLQEIGGCDYVMGVKACIREKDHVVIVMPYFPHDRFQDYVESMTVEEIRDYMRALLTALRRVHQVQIIHRDVKPSNFLYNRITKQYSLVDFGLAMKVPGQTETKETKKEDDAAKKPTRTSPRTTRQRSADKTSPSKKRKLRHEDTENKVVSPQKKRSSNESTHLTELNVNVPQEENSGNLKYPVGRQNFARTVKSPRRALLTKRAMDAVESQQAASTSAKTTPKALDKSGSKIVQSGSKVVQSGSKTVHRNSSPSLPRSNSASGKSMYKSGGVATCGCYGKPQICSVCIARSSQHAPRAGTQGFRSPEVLMKYPQQTTAVDMWSAGVILLSLLSGRYPFFKAQDDLCALAQLISVFGTEVMQKAALTFGKNLLSAPSMPSLDLRAMCLKLRGIRSTLRRKSSSVDSVSPGGKIELPEEAFDLLRGLLDPCPHTRLTAEQALQHPFLTEV